MDLRQLAYRWRTRGYVVLPRFMGWRDRVRLRAACDRAERAWRAGIPPDKRLGPLSNMAYLTSPRWYDDGRVPGEILHFVADRSVLDLIAAITGGAPLFHNTQYFMEQRGADWDGEWHRDSQFLAPDAVTEQRHIAESTGVHFRVALEDDPWLRIVPGSYRRWDTAQEWTIRREKGNGDPDGAVSVPLKAGDAMLFHAWSIHQGLYRREPERRTFDVIYMTHGTAEQRALTPRRCMPSEVRMASLPRDVRAFYERFARTYRRAWSASA
ncbi:MAG: phytanoyl-CoA dioxygenase family protein [Alphaproteobacteria bacterium]|nr:phytanoyl-CoA dioxygenase family protein [Alphaproteobacteria bacterium]